MVSINNDALTEKILAGERITAEEALLLYEWPLEELGALADQRRRQTKRSSYNGDGNEIVTYIVDRNINYTNVCNVYCKFCAFYRTEKDDDHYVISLEQLDQKLDELSAVGGVQILMQGGHHPKLGFEWYINLLRHIREKYPRINIHGFSPPEFQHFAEVFEMPLHEVIAKFKEAGLGSIPGGGGGADLFGQHRKHSELVGDAGTGDRAGRAQIWGQRFWERDDGRKCGEQRGNDISPRCNANRITHSRCRLRAAPAQQLV